MKRAILFLNLGGPASLDQVKPFLYHLFVDPEIIKVKFTPLRMLIAWSIATGRKKTSQALYETIGGGSPIRQLTDEQAAGVEARLASGGKETIVRTAFTASPPFVEDVVLELAASGVESFLAFPLYPQYSFTTTRGSLDRARRAVRRFAPKARYAELRSWPTHPLFLKAHADLIRQVARTFPEPGDEHIHLLFSAHSIPEKLVTEEGDPYKKEVEATVAGVVREVNWKGPYSLAWQSRLGPIKWLEPYTDAAIRDLGARGIRQVLPVPIAFVTDHIETLNEIDILFREIAAASGIREFRRTPGLNAHPLFLDALTDLALTAPGFWD